TIGGQRRRVTTSTCQPLDQSNLFGLLTSLASGSNTA
ncbi:unnamed protein product, partial [Rotaria sordida]